MSNIHLVSLRRLFASLAGLFLVMWVAAQDAKLTGMPIGSLGYDYGTGQTTNNLSAAFDGNLQTAYASYERSKTWVGLDLGTPHVITRVGWSPRNDGLGPGRMVLALFEGSNREDFMDAVPLFLIDQQGTIGVIDHADVNVSLGFRYVRYIGPDNARCNVAEVEFYGHEGVGDSTQFYTLTNLPTISIHTEGNIDPTDKVTERVSIVNLIYDGGTRLQQKSATTRCRGNASFGFPKKPYRIKFDEKVRVLKGSVDAAPAKAKKWTLINNWGDKTLMRNLVAFEVSRRIGMDYTPYSKPVDVIVNGEYRGCYQLSDQITTHTERVDITEMEPTDNEGEALTGGYLLEVDGYANQEKSWFTSSRGIPVTIKAPDEDDITTQQYNYIRSYFNEMERRLFSASFTDEETGYRKVLDVESFMKYFLQEQLVANPDIFWSTYMYKDRNDVQFHVGPCWDFDNAFNNDYRSYDMNDKTDFNTGGASNMDGFVNRILSDPYVARTLRTKWKDYREANVNIESVLAYVDSTAALLDRSQRLNFMRWDILNQRVHMNPQAAGSYEGEVEFVRTFLRGRFAWMDRMLGYGDIDDGFGKTYEISTAAQLADFARAVSNGQAWADAVLKADIDYSAYNQMIGSGGVTYRGTFDGAGHTIKIKMQRTSENAGLFNYVGGTVKNLTVTGTIHTSAKYAGGVVAWLSGGALQQCRSMVDIASTVNGDGTHGGLAGIAEGGATINNCTFAGRMTGSSTNCCGGFVGWANGSTFISNSLMIGDITVDTSGSNILSRNDGNVTAENCYYCTSWKAANNRAGSTAVTEAKVKSGEVCYQLNHGVTNGTQAWYQTLGEDDYPLCDNTHAAVLKDNAGRYYNQGAVFTLLDGTSYEETTGQTVKEFIYKRNFSDTWQPLYLPLDVPIATLKSLGLTVYTVNGLREYDADGDMEGELTYVEVEPLTNGTLQANTPYIVKADESGYRAITVPDAYLYPVDADNKMTLQGRFYDVDLIGTYARMFSSALRAKGAYVVTDTSLEPAASSILHLCRWYALAHATDGGAQPDVLPIVVKGEEEGLGVLELTPAEGAEDDMIYDLSGRRVQRAAKGVHVVNGRKVLK